MGRFHFEPMVYDHVDKRGIYWRGSKTGLLYIFYWNPIMWLHTLLCKDCYFGFLPFKTKHIKYGD